MEELIVSAHDFVFQGVSVQEIDRVDHDTRNYSIKIKVNTPNY